jgi:hypothetical protein
MRIFTMLCWNNFRLFRDIDFHFEVIRAALGSSVGEMPTVLSAGLTPSSAGQSHHLLIGDSGVIQVSSESKAVDNYTAVNHGSAIHLRGIASNPLDRVYILETLRVDYDPNVTATLRRLSWPHPIYPSRRASYSLHPTSARLHRIAIESVDNVPRPLTVENLVSCSLILDSMVVPAANSISLHIYSMYRSCSYFQTERRSEKGGGEGPYDAHPSQQQRHQFR